MGTATITTRTRMGIQDIGRPFIDSILVDGASSIFDLSVESISQTVYPPTVTLAGTTLSGNAASPQYTIDYKLGVISFPTAPTPAQAQLIVSGWAYDYFDDDEVTQAVTDAFNMHVNDLEPLPVIDPSLGQTGISGTEEYLVSIMAAVELLWFRATDASQEIDIHTPEGVFIPRSQRFNQITAQIQALQEEYKTLAGALGVGIWRIQVLNQRRTSYTTNRLVPLYREQEYNAPYAGFVPTAAPVGAIVAISGQYFTNATAVTFGGVASLSFQVLSDTLINAVVPPGAQTGQIGITTPYGIILSSAQFVVGQPPPFILSGPEMVTPPIPPGL